MVKESDCNCLCFIEGTLDTISKKWSLLVINVLGNHQVLRYSELMEELKGISPKSLAARASSLQNYLLYVNFVKWIDERILCGRPCLIADRAFASRAMTQRSTCDKTFLRPRVRS